MTFAKIDMNYPTIFIIGFLRTQNAHEDTNTVQDLISSLCEENLLHS